MACRWIKLGPHVIISGKYNTDYEEGHINNKETAKRERPTTSKEKIILCYQNMWIKSLSYNKKKISFSINHFAFILLRESERFPF